MKKTIFLALIAAVLLLLSGCDAMLEAFYPEYADNYDNYNVLTVEYDLNKLTTQDILDLNLDLNKPIKVEIYHSGDTPVADPGIESPVDSIEVSGEASYWFDFYLPAGSYDVWIWQDSDTSGSLDSGDFVLLDDTNPGTVPNFVFNDSTGQYEYYYGDQWATY